MSRTQDRPPLTSARATCLQALLEWEDSAEFSDSILHRILRECRLGILDRSLVTEIFYGVLRHMRRLDFCIHHLREGRAVDTKTRQLLRLGLYQLMHMRIPDHAAVDETVKLGGKARGLINALLRRAIREREEIANLLENAGIDVQYSFPSFLIERWTRQFSADDAQLLAEAHNRPARTFARCNQLKVTPGELRRSNSHAVSVPQREDMFMLEQIPSSWIVSGLCYIQDPSTLHACDLLSPQPGERVLDACAAPGGKTAYLAQLMKNEGHIDACDASPSRRKILDENLQRLGVLNTVSHVWDWLSEERIPFPPATFDRILADVPCSNTGVLGRRVDARWRLSPEDFIKMPRIQSAILRRILMLLKPGGTLVYSTCSLEFEENHGVVEQVQKEFPDLKLKEEILLCPHKVNYDGAYAALLTR